MALYVALYVPLCGPSMWPSMWPCVYVCVWRVVRVHITPNYSILLCVLLYFTIPYYTTLFCVILYYTMLNYTMLYCQVPCGMGRCALEVPCTYRRTIKSQHCVQLAIEESLRAFVERHL